MNFRSIGLEAVFVLILTVPLHAQYLDPGSGSFLFQILIAGLAVLIFYFSKIKQFIVELFPKKKNKDSAQ
jgi:hypothetical protein